MSRLCQRPPVGVAELGEVCRGRFQKLRYTLRDDVGQLELHFQAPAVEPA